MSKRYANLNHGLKAVNSGVYEVVWLSLTRFSTSSVWNLINWNLICLI